MNGACITCHIMCDKSQHINWPNSVPMCFHHKSNEGFHFTCSLVCLINEHVPHTKQISQNATLQYPWTKFIIFMTFAMMLNGSLWTLLSVMVWYWLIVTSTSSPQLDLCHDVEWRSLNSVFSYGVILAQSDFNLITTTWPLPWCWIQVSELCP